MPLDVSQAQPVVVVDAPQNIVIVESDATEIVVDCALSSVEVRSACQHVDVISGGPMGPPGVVDGETLVLPASTVIHAHRAVRVEAGSLAHPSVLVAAHAAAVVGIAEQSGAAGQALSVRTRGRMTEPSWAWMPGFVWCGGDGVLTQSPDPAGWLLPVARAIDPRTIDIDIDSPVLRA